MKRTMTWVLAAVLLLSLVSCKEKLEVSPYIDLDFDTSGQVELLIEHPVYDKSVTSFNYSVVNHTDQPIEFGAPYAIEILQGEEWMQLPVLPDTGWNSIAYMVEPGGVWSNSFSFWQYDFEVMDGTYRLIKEVDGHLLSAEFSIGESNISGDTPYGYVALEDLEETLDLRTMKYDLATDSVGLIKGGGQEQVAAFLEKVAVGTPSMLRMVTITREGDLVLHDVIYENDHFLYRYDNSRDRFGTAPGIYEQRYSYLVTDGEYIYLSDYASLDLQNSKERKLEAASNVILCLENFEAGEGLAAQVEEMTRQRLEWNVTQARYWSDDGTQYVNLTAEKNSFAISSATYGLVRTLPETAGEDPEIYSVQWVAEGRVQLTFTEKPGGSICRAIFDTAAQELVFMEGRG